jgi:hypothetical protein
VEVPDLGFSTALSGEYDCGNPLASDYNTIQKVGVISRENPDFILSNYDCSGEFDADKMRHASMLLELRWADETMAKTEEKPDVEIIFEVPLGWFPFQLVESSESIFHPEENGQGFTYWYAYVDEGAKDLPGDNGIYYGIMVHFPDTMEKQSCPCHCQN